MKPSSRPFSRSPEMRRPSPVPFFPLEAAFADAVGFRAVREPLGLAAAGLAAPLLEVCAVAFVGVAALAS
jgi:hypothetical protein